MGVSSGNSESTRSKHQLLHAKTINKPEWCYTLTTLLKDPLISSTSITSFSIFSFLILSSSEFSSAICDRNFAPLSDNLSTVTCKQ